jgi:uncharacterized membrane protein YagU involved in acid resistance
VIGTESFAIRHALFHQILRESQVLVFLLLLAFAIVAPLMRLTSPTQKQPFCDMNSELSFGDIMPLMPGLYLCLSLEAVVERTIQRQ